MFFSYKQCIEKYQSDYFLEIALKSGVLNKIEKGIYTDSASWTELDLITYKYPNAIFTLNSAFYYQNLTSVQPDRYYLGTDRNATKIKDQNIQQVFYPEVTLPLGVEEKSINDTTIKLYSKERLLIELIRHKNKLPFDYYKEIISSYRNIIGELNIKWLEENICKFPGSGKIMNAIRLEVY